MTLREEITLILRGKGKTEEQIEEHMRKVEGFFADLSGPCPISVDARNGAPEVVRTVDILDHTTEPRDA